jgi:hypothetical protein
MINNFIFSILFRTFIIFLLFLGLLVFELFKELFEGQTTRKEDIFNNKIVN